MEKTDCSMQNIFDWCLRNRMVIEFRPMPDGYSVNVIFSKRVLGEWYRWSQVASIALVEQLMETPSFFWSNIVQEAQRQLSEEEILKHKDYAR